MRTIRFSVTRREKPACEVRLCGEFLPAMRLAFLVGCGGVRRAADLTPHPNSRIAFKREESRKLEEGVGGFGDDDGA